MQKGFFFLQNSPFQSRTAALAQLHSITVALKMRHSLLKIIRIGSSDFMPFAISDCPSLNCIQHKAFGNSKQLYGHL